MRSLPMPAPVLMPMPLHPRMHMHECESAVMRPPLLLLNELSKTFLLMRSA
jgi:hypothetical protein